MAAFLIGIAGWKNSGKTTLAERLVGLLSARGWRVATVKHAHHPIDPDRPGSDSRRHREAGAVESAVVSPAGWMLSDGRLRAGEPGLAELVAGLPACDIVLAEGFKSLPHPKIECRRLAAADRRPLSGEFPGVVAIASDHPLEGEAVPVFALDAAGPIADFVESLAGLRRDR